MRWPAILFVLSVLALAGTILPGYSDLVLLAGPSALASLFLIILAFFRPGRTRVDPAARVPARSVFRHLFARFRPQHIIVDGSNVMHWKDGVADITTLRIVLDRLTQLGFTPGVIFDANAGYKINGNYQHDGAMGRLLGLPADQVMVVAKGNPADPTILAAARDLGARVVSNDRFRQWTKGHPEVAKPGHLVRGGFRNGELWLDLD